MTQYNLKLNALTRKTFAPFGDVIETEGAQRFSINNGAIERFHNLAHLDIGDDKQARLLFSVAQCNTVTRLPYRIRFIERHPLASQAFYPLFNSPMIIAVAPAGEQILPQSIQAFYSNGNQGINFYRNVWHIPLIALEVNQQFVIVDRGGPGKNCDEFHFNSEDEIILEQIA